MFICFRDVFVVYNSRNRTGQSSLKILYFINFFLSTAGMSIAANLYLIPLIEVFSRNCLFFLIEAWELVKTKTAQGYSWEIDY